MGWDDLPIELVSSNVLNVFAQISFDQLGITHGLYSTHSEESPLKFRSVCLWVF